MSRRTRAAARAREDAEQSALQVTLAEYLSSHNAIRAFANRLELRPHAERIGGAASLDFAGLAHRERGAEDLATHCFARADSLLRPSRAREQNSAPRCPC